MEKVFKFLYLLLSYLLVFTMIWMIIAVPTYLKTDIQLDYFGAGEIAENIKNLEMNMTSVIYVRNTSGEWEEYQRLHGDENRLWVSGDKVPKNLKNALIAIEDETFNSHKGVNWKRTMGAISNYLFKYDDVEYGGSTITQQLIKNVTSDKGKNALRKVREIVRALLIEQRLEKPQILEAYLNTIALGNGICGVQVAANYYFNKDVSELSLIECAAIAAITKNPSKYNPISDMEENRKRRNTVLDKMLELKLITKSEYDNAYNLDITLDDSQADDFEIEINSYFIDALIEDVVADFAQKYNCSEDLASSMLYNGGYKIYATVNPEIQSIMEDVYNDTDKYFKLMGKNLQGESVHVQSAMTIMDYEGHIVGIVGGVGEKTVNRGLNRATGAPRQPGSTMKPLGVYALAIDKDIAHYTSKVLDKPIPKYYPDGKSGPKEWYGYYKGTITLDYAVRKSANTIPVRLLKEIGIEESYKFLTEKLGLKHLTKDDKNLSSLALGGCLYGMTTTESAAAFAIFGNQGVFHEPTTYYKIERFNGETVIDYDETGIQAISPASATIMNHLLQGVVYGSEGTGSTIRRYSSMKAYAKTGTSSEANDLWMVAGTPYYVGSVWYGFDMQQKVKGSSSSSAGGIWRDIMQRIHKNLEKKDFVDSDDVYKKGNAYYKKDSKPDNYAPIGGSSSSSSSSDVSSVVSNNSSSQVSSTVSSENSSGSEGSSSDTVTSEPVTPSEPEGTDPPVSSEPSSGTESEPPVTPPTESTDSSSQ